MKVPLYYGVTFVVAIDAKEIDCISDIEHALIHAVQKSIKEAESLDDIDFFYKLRQNSDLRRRTDNREKRG